MLPVTLEQFFAAYHLRIVAVTYLKPGWPLRIIRRVLVFGYDALQVQLAALLKERPSSTFDVMGVDERSKAATDYAPQFMLSIKQLRSP